MPCCKRIAPYRGASCAVLQPVSLPLLRHNAAPSQDTIFVSRHTPLARPLTRALGRIACTTRRIVPHAQSCVAEPWPYRGPSLARPCLLCHNTLCCIVTKPGNWAVAHPSSCKFFFSHIFFPDSSYWKTTKKNIYYIFFSFSSITK